MKKSIIMKLRFPQNFLSTDFFYYLLINNCLLAGFSAPLLWFYRDLLQIQVPDSVFFGLILFYICNLVFLSWSQSFFNTLFYILTSKQITNFFFKLRFYIPFENTKFLFFLGFSSLICLLFSNTSTFYMYWYSLVVDSLRLFVVPGVLYITFLKKLTDSKIFEILQKKNYFTFKKTSRVEIRFLLFGLEQTAKEFSQLPMDQKLVFLASISGPVVLGLHKGSEYKTINCTEIQGSMDKLEHDKDLFFHQFGAGLTSQQKEVAVEEFTRIRSELGALYESIKRTPDSYVGYGWFNSLVGRETESWETINKATWLANKKANQGLIVVLEKTSKYPVGSLGHIKKGVGIDTSITPISPSSVIEYSDFFCKKLISLFF